MSKHTPGPWKYVPHDGRQNQRIVALEEIVGPRQIKLATVLITAWKQDHSSAVPNARLIAAAPDGLEAAEAAYLALLGRQDIWRVHNQRVYCMLRDFIANATGREAEDVQDDFEQRAFKATQS